MYNVGLKNGTSGRVLLLRSAGIVKITIQPRGFGSKRLDKLRPGHHILLWVPCCQLLGGHPFTVAEVVPDFDSNGTSIVIYARVLGGLTKRMAVKASKYPYGRDMVMYIEGFYGHYEEVRKKRKGVEGGNLCRLMVCPFSFLYQTSPYNDQVLIAGGIGLTHCLPYFVEAIHLNRASHLVWFIRDLCE